MVNRLREKFFHRYAVAAHQQYAPWLERLGEHGQTGLCIAGTAALYFNGGDNAPRAHIPCSRRNSPALPLFAKEDAAF